MTVPPDLGSRDWVSFEADDGDTWIFEMPFFRSNWQCIYGQGCSGIEPEVDVDGQRGCCSYGAHFADEDDLSRVMDVAAVLPSEVWQHHHVRGEAAGDDLVEALTLVDEDGDRITRTIDGACVFLNRPGFELGAGCAIHVAAVRAEIEPLEWKPEVCWQVPVRIEHHLDDNDHSTHFVRQWSRKDWGESGADLGWWCAEAPEAYTGTEAVASYLRAEVAALAGERVADALIAHVAGSGTVVEFPTRM